MDGDLDEDHREDGAPRLQHLFDGSYNFSSLADAADEELLYELHGQQHQAYGDRHPQHRYQRIHSGPAKGSAVRRFIVGEACLVFICGSGGYERQQVTQMPTAWALGLNKSTDGVWGPGEGGGDGWLATTSRGAAIAASKAPNYHLSGGDDDEAPILPSLFLFFIHST